MATDEQRAEKYAEWLIANKDKQGTAEWDTVSSAYKEVRMSAKTGTKKEPELFSKETLLDIGKGLGSGVVRGVEAAASIPDLTSRGISYLLEKPMGLLGLERITEEEKANIPNYIDIQKEIIEPTATAAGARYKPETVAGELAQRTGEFLPFSATKPISLALAPAAAGYGAEKLAEGAGASEGVQMAARLAAEIATPLPATKIGETFKAVADLRKTKNLREIAKSPNLSDTQSTRVSRAANLEDEGIKVSTGQALGDQGLMRSEAQSSMGADFAQSQLEDFTSAVMKRIGSQSKVADSAALVEAQDRIGGMINDVVSGTNVKISAGDVRKSSSALQKFKKLKPSGVEIEDMSNYFANVNRRIGRGVGNPLSADEYVAFRSELSRLTTSGNPVVRDTAVDMLDVVDNAMDKTLSDLGRSSDFAKLNNARSMYRDYLAVEKAAIKAKGDLLTPSNMSSALKQQSGRQFVQRKRGDLGNLVADADEVLKFPSTSGTSENLTSAVGKLAMRYGPRGLVGSQIASALGFPAEVGAVIANIGPATFDRLVLTDKGRQYLIKKMVDSNPAFFTPENARMIVGAIANKMTGQEQ